MPAIQEQLRAALSAFLKNAGAEAGVSAISVETPPSPDKGDLAIPMFTLARALKKAPPLIAQDFIKNAPSISGVERMEAAGGYVNVFLDRAAQVRALGQSPEQITASPPFGKKIIVEHTNINPNKAAHVGHLRNAALGDTWVRMLRALGETVEVQNLIDNLGLQVADVVIAFLYMEGYMPGDIEEAAQRDGFDGLCWDLYAKVQEWYAQDKSREALRKKTLHALEQGVDPEARAGRIISESVSRAHANLMQRLGIRYDILVWESDIVHAHLWKEAFERLKATGGIVLEKEGKNAGCWVMPLSKSDRAEFKNLEDPDKVLLRSDGTATYTAKDIALQMFKHGLVEARFGYKPFLYYGDGAPLWRSWTEEGGETRDFGDGARVYNVIDVRQAYLQHVVYESLRLCGFEEQAKNSIHFDYEMVALTPKTAEALGFALEEDEKKKPYVEMSGRRGLGVKASDLLRLLRANAREEISRRNPDFDEGAVSETAEIIAVGALRYFMLKFTRNKVVAFDLDEAVQFEGETGPYLQYAAVRVKNIFTKVAGAEGCTAEALREKALKGACSCAEWKLDATAWALPMKAAALEQALSSAVASEEPAQFARYVFELAKCWNGFYHANNILHEEDAELKNQRLAVAAIFESRMDAALGILGIPIPDRM